MAGTKKTEKNELLSAVIRGLQEIKGHDIVQVDLREINGSVCDYFVICHGTSNTQAQALAESVEREVFKSVGEGPHSKEGTDNAEWILLDYFDVVVHVFQREAREFYALEKLWADADVKEIEYQS